MEKPRRPILTAPSKISSLSKSSSFTKHQSTTGSSDPATRRVMSPLTKAILLKSSSTPNAEACLISKSNLELSTEKDQYRREKNGFTTDSNSQPETPTDSMPSFQIGLSPVRKLSYTSKTNDTKSINENSLNEPDSKGNNSSEPSREKDVSATPKGENSLNSQNTDTSSQQISPNFMKRDSSLDSSETARETEDSKVAPQSTLRGALDSQNSNLTYSGMEDDDDSKGATCDKERCNFERKTENSVEACNSMDCVKISEKPIRTQGPAEILLDENRFNKTVNNGPINVSSKAAGTPKNIDSDSNKTPTTFGSVSSNSTSMVSTTAQEATSELTSHGTSETAVEISKLSQETPDSAVENSKSSQGTLDSSQGTTGTPDTLHKHFGAGKVVETSSDFIETPELLGGKISDTFIRKPETFMETPEISHKCNDVNNKIVLESESKEVTETSDVNDFVDSDLTLKKTSSMSDIITCTITTNKDVDNKRHTLQPSVERGRTRIISTNDKSPGVLVDITSKQDTADSQTQPDTKNKKVRSQSPGWNLFSRSRANSKGTNKPSKFRSFFSPKDKDKEKSPKMSPKFKSKNFKLFGKSEDVPQIWEIYDIDTPEGTNSAQADVLGISNKIQPSNNQVIHPVASESTLRLQNQVQPSNNKVIHPVASEPTILSPSEAEQPSNLNKNHTVQTPVSSVVLDTYLQIHKNGTETPGLDITSDSQNLCEETSDLNSDKSLQKFESNVSAKRTENASIYEDNGITILSSVPADDEKVPAADGESDSLLDMINMKFNNENKQNSEFLNSDDLVIQNSDPSIMLGNNAPKPPVRRHSSKRQIIQLTSMSSMTSGGNSSQEHENVQHVSHLSSRSNMQTPTQHQTSNGSRLSTQNDVDTESGIKYEMSRNSSSAKSSVPCLNINASISENNIQDVETSPPPIPSPRRRLRRRFSLGPRKLDDDEFIGFASLPEQVHRKAVKRGFEFSLMVVGETGLGKSTLINSLFLTDLYKDRKLPNVQDNVCKTVDISKKSLEIEERGVKLRLTIVDTPGYNDAVNGEECWKNIIDYVDNQFEQYYQAESGLNRKNIQDTRVHCCLYFISPYGHGLKPMDINFMKKLHKKCNIVPLVAKSDILTPKEVKRLKLRILKEIEDNSIEIYQFPDCDSDEDDEFKEQDKALKAAIPFAVVGSNTVVEAGGKRIRGRMYPWGIVEVDNPSHCDFTKLRQMLISTHMQDLKDITSDVHYENYRAEHLASQMNKSQKERSKLKRDSVTNMESVVETEKLLQQKEAEIQRMQAMLAKMQAQLHCGSGQQVNGTVTNTQI